MVNLTVPVQLSPLLKRSISTASKFPLSDFRSHITRHEATSTEKKDLILTILNSTATKREARNYLSKYPLLEQNDIYKNKNRVIENLSTSNIVNNKKYQDLIERVLTRDAEVGSDLRALVKTPEPVVTGEVQLTDTIRLVVVKIRELRKLTVTTVKGIGQTLNKLIKLGASPVVVLDQDYQLGEVNNHTLLIAGTIMEQSNSLIQVLEDNCDLKLRSIRGLYDIDGSGNVKINMPEMITIPLFQGIIPIIYPIGTGQLDNHEKIIDSFSCTKALAEGLEKTNELYKAKHDTDLLTIEKIVFIDELGGIPSVERFQSSHVFINLLQEYDDITAELRIGHLKPKERDVHVKNLDGMNRLLELLPNATGIITTPKIATLERLERTTNPIIHNILTDRPTISSSLPVNLKKTPQLNTTVIRRGMPVNMLLSDTPEQGLDLKKLDKEGIIDIQKLKFLIDDSFKRNLNLDHYLNRINGKVAGLIITGDYEGGAIITWETPSSDPSRKVAYLDKFAVLKKLQGIPGIADIVFKAMLVSFTDELLWRSRINNPVNKWYFERSSFNFCIPETQWRLFYTGKHKINEKDLIDYVEVCQSIVPSFDI